VNRSVDQLKTPLELPEYITNYPDDEHHGKQDKMPTRMARPNTPISTAFSFGHGPGGPSCGLELPGLEPTVILNSAITLLA
jgi:hypothetical protein